MMVSAQALQEMKPLRREELEELRHGKTEVFFDFEGAQEFDENDGLELVNYLIGGSPERRDKKRNTQHSSPTPLSKKMRT